MAYHMESMPTTRPIVLLGVLAAGIAIGIAGMLLYEPLEQTVFKTPPLEINGLATTIDGNVLLVEAVMSNTGEKPVVDIFIDHITAGNVTITQDEYGLAILSHEDAYAEYCHSAYGCSRMLGKSVGFSAGTSDSPSGGMTTDSFIKAGRDAIFILEIRCDSIEYCGTVIGDHVNVGNTLSFALRHVSDGESFLTSTSTAVIMQG